MQKELSGIQEASGGMKADLGEDTFRLKNVSAVELFGEKIGSSEGGSKACFRGQALI